MRNRRLIAFVSILCMLTGLPLIASASNRVSPDHTLPIPSSLDENGRTGNAVAAPQEFCIVVSSSDPESAERLQEWAAEREEQTGKPVTFLKLEEPRCFSNPRDAEDYAREHGIEVRFYDEPNATTGLMSGWFTCGGGSYNNL